MRRLYYTDNKCCTAQIVKKKKFETMMMKTENKNPRFVEYWYWSYVNAT